jgi:cell division protein ZapE
MFEGFFAAGMVVVSTSNHPPANLYTGGVQRERFKKFISLIEEKMDIISLTSPHDYRARQLRSLTRTWFTPLGRDADLFVEDALSRLAPGNGPNPLSLRVQGREIALTAYGGSVVLASFAQLCESALGPADYLTLAAAADTLILTGIPALTPEKRNEAKRFVTLVDALYEHKVKLVATASAAPEALYPEGDGSFEFKRTVSRLMEMQSVKYLGA